MNNTMFQPGEYVTRSGHKARVYATDGSGNWSIHGAIFLDGNWILRAWLSNGHYRDDAICDSQDLMPPKRVRYLNVYANPEMRSAMWTTRDAADLGSGLNRIACVRIEYSEGQFDD